MVVFSFPLLFHYAALSIGMQQESAAQSRKYDIVGIMKMKKARISVQVSPAEARELTERAEALSISVSEALRQQAGLAPLPDLRADNVPPLRRRA